MQNPEIAKNWPSGHHYTTLSGYIFATKACIDSRKNTCKTAISPPHVLTIWPTNGWHPFGSLGHPSKFQRFSRLGSVTARHSSSGRQPNCGVEQRVPTVFGRAAIRLGIGPHSSLIFFTAVNFTAIHAGSGFVYMLLPMQWGFLVVNCWQKVTNLLFPIWEFYRFLILVELKNRKFLTKYDYVLKHSHMN